MVERKRHPGEDDMKIAVYGAGGVGGYYGGRLAVAGHEVHLLARGAHLEAIRANRLTVHSVRGDFAVRVPATDNPADVGPCDVVLFCVKSFDTADAASRLGLMLHEDTAVVSLQNGVDNEDVLAGVIGWQNVVGGASYIFANIAEPGVIDHTGGPASLSVGEFGGHRTTRVVALAEACQEAGIPTDIPADIRVVLWAKYAFICAQAGMTSCTRLPIGDIRTNEPAWQMYRSIVEEVVAVGRAEGVPLPSSLVESHLAAAAALGPEGRSSLYHDLVTGHRMELEALHGHLTRLGAKHAIPTPAASAVYAILSPCAAKSQA
jgi:2-dehydropantoate 2-reductase